MDKKLFKKLTKDVSIGREHTNLFLYKDEVCMLKCIRSPHTDDDFRIVSIEQNEYGYPYTFIKLLDVDVSELKMLIEKDLEG